MQTISVQRAGPSERVNSKATAGQLRIRMLQAMMHEEQKSGTPWNAQKTAREHKKKERFLGNKKGAAAALEPWWKWPWDLGKKMLPVADSKMGFQGFFSGSSPCHAEEDQRAKWMDGELFSSQCFEFTPLHMLLCPCYLLCTLQHRHAPAFDQPHRQQLL
jgi:hypothetical protein